MTSSEKMRVINQIAYAASRKEKATIMKANPAIRGILRICYHPHIHFYVKPTANWITETGTDDFSESTTKLMQALSSRRLSGSVAKRAVIAELAHLNTLSQELLLRILNKDMRCGVQAKTLEAIWPGTLPYFPVQLAKIYDPSKMAYPCFASYKIDGLRCIYEVGRDGKAGKLYSRNGKELIGLDHIVELIEGADMQLTRVDGEIFIPGKLFDDISGDIRSFKPSDNAVYMVFDAHFEYMASPQEIRLDVAKRLCEKINDTRVQFVPHKIVNDHEEAMEFYDQARREGFEGVVLKTIDDLPYDGRNWFWQKVKPHDTIDLVVDGIELGTGKYENQVGALLCRFNDDWINVGSGLSDEQRQQWAEDPSLIFKRTIEVEYMELSKNGKLRHPRLKCVRGDK